MKYLLKHEHIFVWFIDQGEPTFTNSFLLAKTFNKDEAKELANKFKLTIQKIM